MSRFRDLLGDTEADEYGDLDARGTPRLNLGAPEHVKRKVLQKLKPEVEGHTLTGFAGNFAGDVGRFASGMGALLGEVVVHPVKSAKAVAGAIADPIETAKFLAEPTIERYTPEEGESIGAMLARNAYEHPFDSLMDASAIIQGPFGAASRAAKATGAVNTAAKLRTIADAGRAIDPISIAQRAGTKVLKTANPDALARIRVGERMADVGEFEIAREKFLMKEMNQRLLDAEAHLNPAEKAIRFAYGEGRVPIIKDDMITELTHRGAYEERKVQEGIAIRPEALDQWKGAYDEISQDYERAAGLAPEQFAEKMRASVLRRKAEADADPMLAQQAGEEAYQAGLAEATERQMRRRTVSTRTALDVMKEADFRKRSKQLELEQHAFDATEIESMLPRSMPTTIDEALEVMGDRGGLLIPHSMEVMSREQSTVGGALTKLGESNHWMKNAGSNFRAGILEHADPAQALSRAYQLAINGKTFGRVAEDVAEQSIKEGWGLAERMDAKWKPHRDPDVIAGTHQPLHPGSLHLDGSVQEHFERVQSRLMEVADFDEAARNVNLQELGENMARAAEKTFPFNERTKGNVYKVKKSMGDELAFYKKSFEPATNPIATISDKWVMGPFNLVNLGAKGGRLLNNGYGNTEMVVMQGLHPFSARGFMALATAGRAMLGHFGVLTDDVSQKLSKVLELPGVATGGLTASESFSGIRDLGGRIAKGESARVLNNPVGRLFGRYTQMMNTANQNLENIYRAGSLIYEMTPKGMGAVRNLIHGSGSMAAMADRISELRGMGVEALSDVGHKTAVAGMNRWLHNYDRTTALDRNVGRYVFPYYKFYRHSAELLLRYPFEKPVQAQLARRIGQAALQDIKETAASMGFDWDTMVPESMRDAIPLRLTLGPAGEETLVMLNTKGPNPFGFLANGDPGQQALAALHPLAKIAIEQATGVNLFTGEKFQGPLSTFNGRTVDPVTGAIVEDYARPPLVEHYLRQFWPYQTMRDIVANGRTARDATDLIDMVTNKAGTFKLDDRGMERRKGQAAGAATPILRALGSVPSTVQPPTKKQRAAQAATVSSEFASLLQQHPERRDEILSEMRKAAVEYTRPDVPLARRR